MPAVEHKIRSQVPNAPSGPDLFYKVDDFSGRADLFLCTHFHADHLAGLDDRWAERQTAQIVTSTQTAHMLRKRFPALACDLLIHSARGQRRMPRVLAFEIEPTMQHNIIVDHQQEHSVTVTLIDANHCPGSVMFVVDSGCGKRLHTGDFRFDAELHLPDNCAALQGLREVHMDTTFFDPSWVLPTKSESIQMVTEIVRSQAVEEKKRPVILAVDMLGQEEILSAVQRNLRDSHGHIVLPLNRCNEELMNRNAFTVWNAWLDPKMCPTMSGVVERAGQCRHCQICAPDTVPCSRDTQPTALGKSGAQGGGGHMDVEDGRLYSEGCAQRPLDTAAGAVAGGREAVKTGKEGVGNENKCCDWARTPGKIAMIACTYWRRKRAARGKRNLVHGTQPATAVTDRPAASASDAISKARIQPEDSQSNISAGINLQNLAHKMIGRRTPSMIDAVKLCLAERRIESGEQGAPSAAHPSRTCYPSSNYIGDVRRYYQHRHEEVVVVRCSTLAFGTREADSPEDKPCDADLVKRGNVGNIKYRSDNFWRVLFSMHSSYPELVRFHDAVMDASSQVSFFHSLPGQDKHGKEIPEELFQRKPDAKFVEACGRPIAVQVRIPWERRAWLLHAQFFHGQWVQASQYSLRVRLVETRLRTLILNPEQSLESQA